MRRTYDSTIKVPPVRVHLLRTRFTDGKWRTVADMATALYREIPMEDAFRAAIKYGTKYAAAAEDEPTARFHQGCKTLVMRALDCLRADPYFEKRGRAPATEFRFLPRDATETPTTNPGGDDGADVPDARG